MKRTFPFLILVLACASLAMAGMELTSAKIYRKQGEIAKAMEFYDQAVAKEPDNAEAVFERGELLGIIAMDQAQVGVRKKIAGEIDDPQLAVLEKMVKDFDAVRAMAAGGDKKAQKFEKKIKTISEAYWWEFYSKAVDAEAAYRSLEETRPADTAVEVRSKSMETQAGEDLSIVSITALNPDSVLQAQKDALTVQGLADATTAIMLDPKHWSSRFVYAQLRGFQTKDAGFVAAWHEAITALDNSDLKTTDAENYKHNRYYAQLQLIQNYYAKEDYAKTLETADIMLADDPTSVEPVQYKAFALATMASDEKRPVSERDSLKRVALGALDNAKVSNPDDENILFYIGQFNLQLADTAAALKAFDEFLLKAPSDGAVLAQQGVIFLEGGPSFNNLDMAIKKLEAAKDAEPENGAYWTNYGIALLRKGQNEDGMKAMEKGKSLLGN